MEETNVRADPKQYREPSVQSAYQWFVEKVVARIWNEEDWNQTAKGGEWEDPSRASWERKYDLPYIGHILSGAQCALKILDTFLSNPAMNPDLIERIKNRVERGPTDPSADGRGDWRLQLSFRLKRALLGYLFHDYVKLTGDDYRMKDSRDSLSDLVNMYFHDTLSEVSMSTDDIYQIAFSTEEDTKFNALSSRVQVNPMLTFESGFSSLADKISSKFAEPLNIASDQWFRSLKFLEVNLFTDYSVFKTPLGSTYFVAVTDLLRNTVVEIISSSGGHYLWSTPDAIYYIARSRISIEPEKVAESLAEYISGQMMEIADSIEFTDRRINIPGKQMVYITEEVLREVAGKPEKLKQALRPEDKPVPQDAMEALARYRDVVNREFKGDLEVSLTPRGSKPLSYRNLTEGVSDLISDTEKMKKVILIRIVQLIGSQVREGEFEKVKELLDSLCSLEGGNAVINALLRETKEVNKRKNPLLIPLVVALSGLDGKAVAAEIGIPDDLAVQASGIDWHALAAEVSRELSSETSETGFKDNLLKIVRIILGPSSVDLPDVPDKRNMSMIDGYPGETEAIKENLYGLRTNAIFTNRVVTSAIQNSLVDGRYVLESFLRKKLGLGESREGSVFVFFDFPGPIPFFDLYRILNYLASNQKAENWAAERIDEIVVSLRRRKGPLRQDTSYFLAVDQPETTSDALRLYEEAIRLASGTKLRVQVIDSHSPPALQQREIFNYAVNNFVLDELGISRVRYNKLQEVLAFLEDIGFLANISRSSSKNRYDQEAEILREFIREPISLFSYCMDAVRSQENRGESGRGSSSRRFRFPPHLKAKVELYAERGFGGVKGGVSVESVKKLARIARELWPPRFDMSGSQRSWMLRESLDVLEKALSETVVGAKEKVDLGNYLEFVEGHLYKGLQAERDKPDSKHYVRLDSEKIREFSRTFLEMIEKDFHGRPPTGNMKSYLIDAFEFEYVMGE